MLPLRLLVLVAVQLEAEDLSRLQSTSKSWWKAMRTMEQRRKRCNLHLTFTPANLDRPPCTFELRYSKFLTSAAWATHVFVLSRKHTPSVLHLLDIGATQVRVYRPGRHMHRCVNLGTLLHMPHLPFPHLQDTAGKQTQFGPHHQLQYTRVHNEVTVDQLLLSSRLFQHLFRLTETPLMSVTPIHLPTPSRLQVMESLFHRIFNRSFPMDAFASEGDDPVLHPTCPPRSFRHATLCYFLDGDSEACRHALRQYYSCQVAATFEQFVSRDMPLIARLSIVDCMKRESGLQGPLLTRMLAPLLPVLDVPILHHVLAGKFAVVFDGNAEMRARQVVRLVSRNNAAIFGLLDFDVGQFRFAQHLREPYWGNNTQQSHLTAESSCFIDNALAEHGM